jgi:hypothetical protein
VSQFEHLELPRTSIELPRRSKGGGGGRSHRSDRGSHGRQLLDQISGLTQRSKQKTSPYGTPQCQDSKRVNLRSNLAD